MYLELSRPNGDVSRWEKVFTRLQLLNKYHPLRVQGCETGDYGRGIRTAAFGSSSAKGLEDVMTPSIRKVIVDAGIKARAVFMGAQAIELYTSRFKKPASVALPKVAMPYYIISEKPSSLAKKIRAGLKTIGVKSSIKNVAAVGEIVPVRVQIMVDDAAICTLFETTACHAYVATKVHGKELRIGTVDTILSFYLALAYSNIPRKDAQFLQCASQYLFILQNRHTLERKGILKRFVLACYGHQKTLAEARADRGEKFKSLKKNDPEREKWFLRYAPSTATPPVHLLDRRGTVTMRNKPRAKRRTIRCK